MRIALGLAYKGTYFHGFQRQDSLRTVQSELESALSQVAQEPISIICAGRTDVGVHALNQVIHFDTKAERPDRAWVLGVNTHLPDAVSVQWMKHVSEDFHARFSCVRRHYRYVIYNHVARSGVFQKQVTWFCEPLNIKLMQKAAKYLLGERDFTSFRSSECQSHSPMRHVDYIRLKREGHFIFIDIAANAFLHHMVRNIVGVLVPIGQGIQKPIWAREVLLARDRRQAGMTMPADGLYFFHAEYEKKWRLPEAPIFL